MQFTPKSEADVSAGKTKFKPLPDGVYPFTVLESDEVPSKSQKNFGRLMVKLKLAAHGPDGRDQWVYDYFADWFSEWKLKHFADATGQADLYNTGGIDFANNRQRESQGWVRLAIEVSDDGRERNVVDDYMADEAESAPKAKQTPAKPAPAPLNVNPPEGGDDVPF
jgi:hypothetical protein